MVRMYSNAESTIRDFGDILQLKLFILDSGAACHIAPEISNCVRGSLVERDKCIEVADEHFFTKN